MIVHIGADHAGFKLKEQLKKHVKDLGYSLKDHGAKKLSPTDDYPDYAHAVARSMRRGDKGILICGSAEGICIAANKHKKIRAVAVWTIMNAKLSRQHNDSNVLCLSGWQLSLSKAKAIVKTWLSTPFSNEERHVRRIRKIEP